MKWLKNNWFEIFLAMGILFAVNTRYNFTDKFTDKFTKNYDVGAKFSASKKTSQPREMMNKVVRLKQNSRQTFTFTSGSQPLRVRLAIQSTGAPVDFFISTKGRYKETMLEQRSRKRDGVYMETHEVMATVKEVTLPANGTYVLGIRHADGPFMNLISKNEPSAAVMIKFFFL